MQIHKIKLINFKKFKNLELSLNDSNYHIFIGDNEAGKSTILQAIDLVCSGSVRRIETIGLARLFNKDTITEFLKQQVNDFPKMIVELYLKGCDDFDFEGKNNTDKQNCYGIRLICELDDDYQNEMVDSLKSNREFFPFEYYKIRFSTFADTSYSDVRKKAIKSLFIDESSNLYSLTDFIKREFHYSSNEHPKEKAKILHKYNDMRNQVSQIIKDESNFSQGNTTFGLKTTNEYDFENDLMLFDNGMDLSMKGKGTQSTIATKYALSKRKDGVGVVLLEEPENHLSHTRLLKLLEDIKKEIGQNTQLFIATHNNDICSRLDLKNVIVLGGNDTNSDLDKLSAETAKYFMKTPPASLIEFCLSDKTILVEGPAEMILMDLFFEILLNKRASELGINVLDLRGLSFKRYLEVGKLLNKKVAVITDNDQNKEYDVQRRYQDFIYENAKIFTDKDSQTAYTFEASIFKKNANYLKRLFGDCALQYMLGNKTESALKILEDNQKIEIPDYISEAIQWITK